MDDKATVTSYRVTQADIDNMMDYETRGGAWHIVVPFALLAAGFVLGFICR